MLIDFFIPARDWDSLPRLSIAADCTIYHVVQPNHCKIPPDPPQDCMLICARLIGNNNLMPSIGAPRFVDFQPHDVTTSMTILRRHDLPEIKINWKRIFRSKNIFLVVDSAWKALSRSTMVPTSLSLPQLHQALNFSDDSYQH